MIRDIGQSMGTQACVEGVARGRVQRRGRVPRAPVPMALPKRG